MVTEKANISNIAAGPAGEVWTFGSGSDGHLEVAIARENAPGASIPGPVVDSAPLRGQILGAAIINDQDVWAGGVQETAQGVPKLWRWNGSSWEDVTPPLPSGVVGLVDRVTGDNDADLIVTGHYSMGAHDTDFLARLLSYAPGHPAWDVTTEAQAGSLVAQLSSTDLWWASYDQANVYQLQRGDGKTWGQPIKTPVVGTPVVRSDTDILFFGRPPAPGNGIGTGITQVYRLRGDSWTPSGTHYGMVEQATPVSPSTTLAAVLTGPTLALQQFDGSMWSPTNVAAAATDPILVSRAGDKTWAVTGSGTYAVSDDCS